MHAEQSQAIQQPEWRTLSNLFPALGALPEISQDEWQHQTIKSGDTLFSPGSRCHRFVLLGEGRIRIQMQNHHGRRLTLYRLLPGQLCMHSLFNLVNQTDYTFEAVVEASGWLSWVPKTRFQTWLAESDEFRNWIFASIGERYQQLLEVTSHVAFSSIDTRLADLLIERMGEDNIVRATQSDLAAELGTAREVVLRHLKRWEQQGLLQRARGCLQINDVFGMLALIEGPSNS